jgi:hypothetical protein
MKATEWKTYRTRFLVKAKQLNSSLTFTDSLGRQHSGRKGDYLVESSDGILRIAPRQIFEDIYVAMTFTDHESDYKIDQSSREGHTKKNAKPKIIHADDLSLVRRKLPQSTRERRTSPRLGWM